MDWGRRQHQYPAGDYNSVAAVATDASGNVFVTGVFGSTGLINAGNQNLFVAKYMPSTSTGL